MIALNRRKILKWLLRGALFFFAWILVQSALISIDGLVDSNFSGEPADAAIVLGNLVFPDGTCSPVLTGRLKKALELYRKGAVKRIVCSGGRATEDFWEADCMRDWLVAQSVPASAIIVDNEGKDSFCTAQQAKKLIGANGWHTVVIVSSFTHISRCKLAFSRAGITAYKSAHKDFEWSDFKGMPHEIAGYYFYWFRKYD